MRIDGDLTVQARREVVFDAISDARIFASCIAGMSELSEIDPMHYSAVMETRLSFMRFKFKVTVEIVRVEPPREIEAKIEGTPLGFLGRLTATSVTTLTESERETRLRYAMEVALTGKLGSLGQSAFAAKAREMTKQFGDRLRAVLQSPPCEAAR